MFRVIAFAFSLVFLNPAWACTYFPKPIEEKYSDAEKVFLGSFISADLVLEDGKFRNRLKLTFLVQERFKGQVSKKENVTTGTGGSDCGLGANFNVTYLVYVDENGGSYMHNGSHGMLKRLTMDGGLEYQKEERAILAKVGG